VKITIKKIKISKPKNVRKRIQGSLKKAVRKVKNIKASDIREYIYVDWRTYKTLIAKELKSYLINPATYIILVVFLLAGFLFLFSDFFLISQATLSGYFDVLPWLLLLLIPALTMNLFSAERRDGTLEYLLTQPITSWQLIVSKYLSVIIFSLVSLLLMLPMAIAINFFGDIDFGVLAGQLLAGLFLIAGISGIGTLLSMLLKSPIAAFLSTALVSFFWLILGAEIVTRGIPVELAASLENISLLSHYNAISRGVIDLRELLFILAVVAIFLTATFVVLQYTRYPKSDPVLSGSRVRLVIVAILAVVIAYAGALIPGRIDLTERGLYSISSATTEILGKLTEDVDITVYASENLPAQFQPVLREIKYLLQEYSRLSGNVKVSYTYVTNDEESITAATSAGIQQMQFNVYGQGDVQFKNGFLGIVIKQGEGNETMPFVENTKDLEYQLTSKIYQLSGTDKPVVAFLGTKTKYTESSGLATLAEELSNQFEITSYDLSTALDPATTKLLIIGGTTEALSDAEKQMILDYFNNGGNILALVDGVNVEATTSLSANKNEAALTELFKDYGVTVNTDIVYDLASSETVQTQNGYYVNYISYPFWVLATPVSTDSTITKDIENVLLPWPSSITIADSSIDGVEASALLTSTKYSGSDIEGAYDITLDRDYPQDEASLGTYTLGAEVKLLNEDDTTKSRAIVIGNTESFNDQFMGYNQNGGLALQIVENLTQAASLSEIKIKDRSAAALVFTNSYDENILKFVVPALSIVAVVACGVIVIVQRKKISKRVYVA